MQIIRNKRTARRMALVIGTGIVLGAVTAILAASKLGGDAKVMDDIDRHFNAIEASQTETNGEREEGEEGEELESPSRVLKGPRVVAVARPEQGEGGQKRATGQKGRRSRTASGAKTDSAFEAESANRWRGIRKVASGTYVIAERLVVDARKQPDKYLQGARATPAQRGGNLIGFSLVGIGEGSALYALGFRNQDVIVGVNGHELTSVDEALLAAGTLRFARKLRFDLLRGGHSRSLYYRIDPD